MSDARQLIDRLHESPDTAIFNGEVFRYKSPEAYPFGFRRRQVPSVSWQKGGIHVELTDEYQTLDQLSDEYEKFQDEYERGTYFDVVGRLWFAKDGRPILSFWNSQAKVKANWDLLGELAKEIGFNLSQAAFEYRDKPFRWFDFRGQEIESTWEG